MPLTIREINVITVITFQGTLLLSFEAQISIYLILTQYSPKDQISPRDLEITVGKAATSYSILQIFGQNAV